MRIETKPGAAHNAFDPRPLARKAAAVFALLALSALCSCSSSKTRFGYVATGQGVFAFRMDAGTGAASQIFGSPFVAKTNASFGAASASSVIVHPSNKFLYVADQDIDSISLFDIDSTTGALTEVQPRTALTTSAGGVGLSPAVLTMDSSGQFLFVANQATNDVWVFSIGPSGALTFVSSAQLAAAPGGLTLSASGNLLYVPVPAVSAVYVFGVNGGTLTQVGTPFIVSGGVGTLAVDPGGNFLYVPNPSADTVTVLRIQSDGSLTFGSGAFATGLTPTAAATNPTGAYLYVANFGATNLSQYQVDSASGTLTPLTTATASTGTQPLSILIDPDAKFAFVVNQQSRSVTEFTFNSNGTLGTTNNALQLNVEPRSFSITK
jgi:6-phosphogluconolactonase (cycloisomerase 2 family)